MIPAVEDATSARCRRLDASPGVTMTSTQADAMPDEAGERLLADHDDRSGIAALVPPRPPAAVIVMSLVGFLLILLTATTLLAEPPRHSRAPMLAASHAPRFKPWSPVPVQPDGRKLAYMFYATDDLQACHALMAGTKIRALGTPSFIEIVALVTEDVSAQARQVLADGGVRPLSVAAWRRTTGGQEYVVSLTKLRIFQELGYDRVIYMDSDVIVVKNLDELFNLPHAVFWAPRAYWLEDKQPHITSVLLVVDPDNELFQHLEYAIETEAQVLFDMDVLNEVWRHVAGILPSEFMVLTANLKENVDRYLFGYKSLDDRVNHTYMYHFSGGHSKPWLMDSDTIERQPDVIPLYYDLYLEYWTQRRAVCSFLR